MVPKKNLSLIIKGNSVNLQLLGIYKSISEDDPATDNSKKDRQKKKLIQV